MSKIHGLIDGVLQKECAKCHKVKPVETDFFKAVRGLYKRHNYCKDCCRLNTAKRKGQTPKKELNLQICSRLGCTKPPRNRFERYCSKKCGRYVRDKEKLKAQKSQAVSYLGGQCLKCGYSKCLGALHFHHRDPKTKLFEIGRHIRPWKSVKLELDKCDLLCANCHLELYESWDWDDVGGNTYDQKFRRRLKNQALSFLGRRCSKCSQIFKPSAMTFHHKNPALKKFNITQKRWRFERLILELEKCEILCANCHHEKEFS